MNEFKKHPDQEMCDTRPAQLDIVKINGRWAQVVGARGAVKYLNDLTEEQIDWNNYELIKPISQRLKEVLSFGTEKFSGEEIDNIHWGSEQKLYPNLKKQVTVFGEFKKI